MDILGIYVECARLVLVGSHIQQDSSCSQCNIIGEQLLSVVEVHMTRPNFGSNEKRSTGLSFISLSKPNDHITMRHITQTTSSLTFSRNYYFMPISTHIASTSFAPIRPYRSIQCKFLGIVHSKCQHMSESCMFSKALCSQATTALPRSLNLFSLFELWAAGVFQCYSLTFISFLQVVCHRNFIMRAKFSRNSNLIWALELVRPYSRTCRSYLYFP